METIILIIGFTVVVFYLHNIDKNIAKSNEIALMSERERERLNKEKDEQEDFENDITKLADLIEEREKEEKEEAKKS